MVISVWEVVNDPDLAQPFTVLRSTGIWLNGEWQSTTTTLQAFGVICEPTDRELKMIPEGDVAEGYMMFHTSTPIYGTRGTLGPGGAYVGGSSDILIWEGRKFRVLDVKQYQDYGYYHAMGVRMKAD